MPINKLIDTVDASKVFFNRLGWLVVFNIPSTARSFRDGFNRLGSRCFRGNLFN